MTLLPTVDARRSLALAQADHRFFTIMALVITSVVVLGFSPTYFLKAFYGTPALPRPLVHLHGLMVSVWIALFVVQTTLVGAGGATCTDDSVTGGSVHCANVVGRNDCGSQERRIGERPVDFHTERHGGNVEHCPSPCDGIPR